MADTYNIEAKQLNELEEQIRNKENELLKEIQTALLNDKQDVYEHLKGLQLQCRAQIRLINHIKTGLTDEKYIIC